MTTVSNPIQTGLDESDNESMFNYQNEANSIEEAQGQKDKGNLAFAQSDYSSAKQFYLKGLRVAKKLKDEEATQLQKSLYLNLSITYISLNEFQNAIHTATNALRIEPKNVKALYRRGLAREQSNQYKEAKEDFMEVLQLNPTNSKAKEHLNNVNKKIKSKNKQAIGSGMFNSNLGLYSDKEFDHEEAERKRKEEENALHEEWLKYVEENEKNEDTAMTFDKYKEMKREKAMKNNENNNKKNNNNNNNNSTSSSPSHRISGTDSLSDLDEEEQKIMEETKKMGYCYFHKELTEDEKKQKENFKPQLLKTASQSSAPQPISINEQLSNSKTISSWNVAGTTYEEKDITNSAKELLTSIFKALKVELSISDVNYSLTSQQMNGNENFCKIEIEDVQNITMDAHFALVRGKPRYFYDFACTLKAEMLILVPSSNIDENEPVKYSVKYTLSDIHNLDGDSKNWLNDINLTFNNKLSNQFEEACKSAANKFKNNINSTILQFVDNLKNL